MKRLLALIMAVSILPSDVILAGVPAGYTAELSVSGAETEEAVKAGTEATANTVSGTEATAKTASGTEATAKTASGTEATAKTVSGIEAAAQTVSGTEAAARTASGSIKAAKAAVETSETAKSTAGEETAGIEADTDSGRPACSNTNIQTHRAFALAAAEDPQTTETDVEEEIVDSGNIGANAAYTLTGDGTLTISGSGATYSYNQELNTYAPFNKYRSQITRVVIQSGITSIGDGVLWCCQNMTDVTIPPSVTTIGYRSFLYDYALRQITLPRQLKSIGKEAFYGCRSLERVELPDTVTVVGDKAFANCDALDVIPGVYSTNIRWTITKSTGIMKVWGTGRLANYNPELNTYPVWNYCKASASSLQVDEGITYIGDYDFWGFSNLKTVSLPSSLTEIGQSAFLVCRLLEKVELPNAVTQIGAEAFKGCTALSAVTLPESLTAIGSSAFQSCTALTEITIPEGVTSCSSGVFQGCSGLTSVHLPSGLDSIESSMFENCTALSSIDLPDSLKGIYKNAFKGCASLSDLHLPQSLTGIQGNAFEGCSSLTGLELPDALQTIESNAFKDCSSLKELTIPGSVMTYRAGFQGCTSLEKVLFGDGITVDYFPDDSFRDCASLTTITLPEGLTRIGSNSFYNCGALTSITIPASVSEVGENAFFGCTQLRAAEVLNPVCRLTNPSFVTEGMTLSGYNGSTAEAYAELYGFTFESLGEPGISGMKAVLSAASYTYDGTEKTPRLTITGLTEGTDFTVDYQNNTDAGTARAIASGIGSYSGQVVVDYTIEPASMLLVKNGSRRNIYLEYSSAEYTGGELTPKITVGNYEEGKDYTVTYSDNVVPGEASAEIQAVGNYQGSTTVTFTISPKSVRNLTISDIPDQIYTGEALAPALVLTNGSLTLEQGTDYTVSYSSNTNVGNAYATVVGKGNYNGSVYVYFKIAGRPISEALVSPIDDQSYYNGAALTPPLTVLDGDKTLEEGRDYRASYRDNTVVGKAAVTLTGIGNYSGTLEASFQIVCRSLTTASISPIENQVYTGKAIEPAVLVNCDNSVLILDTDYTVAYTDNVSAGKAAVTVTGIGNYTGTSQAAFQITPRSLGAAEISPISEQTYTRSSIEPAVTVTCGDTLLIRDTDYTVTYARNTDVGTAAVYVAGVGNYTGTATASFRIVGSPLSAAKLSSISDQIYTGASIEPEITVTCGKYVLIRNTDYWLTYTDNVSIGRATVTITGIGSYSGTREVSFNIIPGQPSLSGITNTAKGVKLTWNSDGGVTGYIIYRNDKKVKTIKKNTTVSWTDSSASSNGTGYTYRLAVYRTVGGVNYCSSRSAARTVYYVSRPAIKSAKNTASKKAAVKWGKNNAASGYQIRYVYGSTSRTVAAGRTATSKTLDKLKKGRTYKVYVRAYKTVGGKKYYSAWSAAKSVKISK